MLLNEIQVLRWSSTDSINNSYNANNDDSGQYSPVSQEYNNGVIGSDASEQHDISSADDVHSQLQKSITENVIVNLPYADFNLHKKGHSNYNKNFFCNQFGYFCMFCDRIWFQNYLKKVSINNEETLKKILVIKNDFLHFNGIQFQF